MKQSLFFVVSILLVFPFWTFGQDKDIIMTVNGPIAAKEMGITLMHEHVLVDFAGAAAYNPNRWNKEEVIEHVLPYLNEIKAYGCKTFVECTPSYIGKDPVLLKKISEATGIHLLTNTGFYGAGNNKYIPYFAFTESADQLAERWINEWRNGIEGTGIKPGFIKIGVDGGTLSEMHQKLITAASRTHLATGLVILSHTGPSLPAFEQVEILRKEGVRPDAFVWTHAQAESDPEIHAKVARMGAWVALDGLNDSNVNDYVRMIVAMKNRSMLHRVLLSHDAGWYTPGEENGGDFRGFTTLFEKLIPALRTANFTDEDIHQLIVNNPAEAFQVKIRKISQNND